MKKTVAKVLEKVLAGTRRFWAFHLCAVALAVLLVLANHDVVGDASAAKVSQGVFWGALAGLFAQFLYEWRRWPWRDLGVGAATLVVGALGCWFWPPVYFFMVLVLCGLLVGIVQTGIRFSPFATEGDWPWTKGRVTEALPFAVEYRRAKTFCAEYDKRVVFRSGKRVGLLMDTCGYGPFRVYRLKDGTYCLEDGFGLANDVRHQRVDVKRETVELKQGGAWYAIPGGGFIRGYGGVPGSLSLTFSMYSGGDLNNEEGWDVDVTGTPVGDSLDGMELIGEIETSGRFFSLED